MTSGNKNTPDPLIKQVNEASTRELDRDISRAFDTLFSNPESRPKGSLPESVFRTNFLPFFTGQQDDNASLNLTTSWIAIAGGPMNPVDITNDKGEVVVTIPPYMSSDFLHPKSQPVGPSFNHIFNTALQKSKVIPEAGGRLIGTDGPLKVGTYRATPSIEQEKQWKKVFDHFGVNGKSVGIKANGKPADGPEELVYD